MTDRTELQRMKEEFIGIADDAERLAFYRQHYETINYKEPFIFYDLRSETNGQSTSKVPRFHLKQNR